MRRARIADSSTAMSLFPFLAVLVCTMGGLIVLLVVISRQARLAAAQHVLSEDPAAGAEPSQELKQKVAQWEMARTELASAVERDRGLLGHLEARIRTLKEKIWRLEAAARELLESGRSNDELRQRDEQEVVRLKQLITEAQQQLVNARREAESRPRSYAVIPYHGASGTNQRPSYIECLAESVVLQPEGIVLKAQDFEDPLGPGNPLASALRAAQQYFTDRQLAPQPDHTAVAPAPYPLILVRPQGIAAYYKVREAIEEWGTEFGYELIEEDWKIEYPAPDPQLAEIEQRAVDQARVRRATLALVAPSRFAAGGGTWLRASARRGGFEPVESAETSESRSGSARTRQVSSSPKRALKSSNVESHASGKPSQTSPPSPRGPNPAGNGSGDKGNPNMKSLAAQRGRNWALPDASQRAVPISRTVHLVVRPDQLDILSDSAAGELSARSGKVVPLADRLDASLDQFVSALWDHMKLWGIAGSGMYWRPELVMHVSPGGEQRAAELTALLDGSGVEIRKAYATE